MGSKSAYQSANNSSADKPQQIYKLLAHEV
jgi:hypothetical protein